MLGLGGKYKQINKNISRLVFNTRARPRPGASEHSSIRTTSAALKRFDSRGRKVVDDVTFPRELTVGTARYAFAAVVEHQGRTKREGHYVAHVQSRELLCCNDAKVTETTWERIASRQAYVLAYVRADH